MSAPDFGDTAAATRPSFGADRSGIGHRCPRRWSLPCDQPGPHATPAPVDPATLTAFPDLDDAPTVWSTEPAAEPERCEACGRADADVTDHEAPGYGAAGIITAHRRCLPEPEPPARAVTPDALERVDRLAGRAYLDAIGDDATQRALERAAGTSLGRPHQEREA